MWFARRSDAQTPSKRTSAKATDQDFKDAEIVRIYAGAFIEKMVGELARGERKSAEHVFRNLSLYLSPPVSALDGGGSPLAALRETLPPGAAARYDKLGVCGARLADALLAEFPHDGASAHDPARALLPPPGATPSAQWDTICYGVLAQRPVREFRVGK